MTFSITRHGQWKMPYWKNDISSKKYVNSCIEEYSQLDKDVFKDILKDELDVPDYAITEENINREFGYSNIGRSIPDDCMKQIIKYYRWRKNLYNEICKKLIGKHTLDMLVNSSCDEIKFKFIIPAEYNEFSCEDPNYDSGQLEAYIEIGFHR